MPTKAKALSQISQPCIRIHEDDASRYLLRTTNLYNIRGSMCVKSIPRNQVSRFQTMITFPSARGFVSFVGLFTRFGFPLFPVSIFFSCSVRRPSTPYNLHNTNLVFIALKSRTRPDQSDSSSRQPNQAAKAYKIDISPPRSYKTLDPRFESKWYL